MTATATARGWYPVDNDDHRVRFWTGTQWMGERVWNGNDWVACAEDSQAPQPPVVHLVSRPSATFFVLGGGAVATLLGAFMPWVQVTQNIGVSGFDLGSVTQTAKLTGVGVLYVIAMAVGVVWLGFPTIAGKLRKGRCIGLTAVAALMPVLVLLSFAHYSHEGAATGASAKVAPGVGMCVFGAGMVAVFVGVLRAWLGRTPGSNA